MDTIIIKQYDLIAEAYNDKNLLENEGVKSEILGEYFAGVYPGISTIAPIQLLVMQEDEQKAKEILGIE